MVPGGGKCTLILAFLLSLALAAVSLVGRVLVLRVRRWPAAMRLTPDVANSMTAM